MTTANQSRIKKVRFLIRLSLLLVVFLLSLVPGHSLFAFQPSSPPPPDTPIAEPSARPSSRPGLTSNLSELHDRWAASPTAATDFAESLGLAVQEDRVKVTVTADSTTSAQQILQNAAQLNADVTAHYERWLDLWVPVTNLPTLGEMPGVILVEQTTDLFPLDNGSRSDTANLLAGSVLSQGVSASNADHWQGQQYTGSGVSVAVLDWFQDYQLAQDAGELPGSIQTYGSISTTSPHGTAVAEIIYDMAPGISFTFSTPSTATELASSIVGLAQADNDIISSSIGFYNSEPGDGTGPVSNAIATARNEYGTLYVQAAGNQAQYHWDGAFRDSNANGLHEFADGVDINQLGYLPAGTYLQEMLRWNAWPTTNQDYDLYIFYYDGTQWIDVAASVNDQESQTLPPTELIVYTTEAEGYYALGIDAYSVSGTHILDMMGHNSPSYEYNVSERSLVDPATSQSAFAVAAVDALSPFSRMPYSSQGPTHGAGGALTGGHNSPHIAGYSHVDTWSYGVRAFSGTSAATPHVSGAAALVMSRFPGYGADEVESYLRNNSIDMGGPGYDLLYGSGRLWLPDYVFADVPVEGKEWMQPWIENFYQAGITTGCAADPLAYCPEREVTRAEMAVFLLRGLHYPDLPHNPADRSGTFADMPVAGKEWMEEWVEEFYNLGITTGCSADPLSYCPERQVTRSEMAVFILRALYGGDYQPPAASHTFADVPVTGKEWMEPWVDQFYREGITTGCGTDSSGNLLYCPERPVTRAEMAVFILRAFDSLPAPE